MTEEMNEGEFLRASFFSSDADFEAAKTAAEKALAEKAERTKRREEFRSARAFIRVMERLDVNGQRAWIGYLYDRFIAHPRKK